MKRPVLAALALAFTFIPCTASAQLMPLLDEPVWGPRFSITPFIGVSPAVTRRQAVTVPGDVTETRFETRLGTGPAAGVTAEAQVYNQFSLLAAGLVVAREGVWYGTEAGDSILVEGADYFIGKAGVSVRIRESDSDLQLRRLGASAFLAPAIILERDGGSNTTQFGINFGATGELPLSGGRYALTATVEDFYTFWDEDALSNDMFDVTVENSHQYLISAGFSFRFR